MRNEDDADYAVGYGRPPKETQFKKGQSGNPKGRPKGSKSWKSSLDEILNERMTAIVRGKSRKITLKEGITRTAVLKALNGDLKMLSVIGAFDEPVETLPQWMKDMPEDMTIRLKLEEDSPE